MTQGDSITEFTQFETVIPDDYPVYWDYIYIIDGKVFISDVKGTILTLKHDLLKQGKINSLDVEARIFDTIRILNS